MVNLWCSYLRRGWESALGFVRVTLLEAGEVVDMNTLLASRLISGDDASAVEHTEPVGYVGLDTFGVMGVNLGCDAPGKVQNAPFAVSDTPQADEKQAGTVG